MCLGTFALKRNMYFCAPNGHSFTQPACRDCHEREVQREMRNKIICRPLHTHNGDQDLFAFIRLAHSIEFAEERRAALKNYEKEYNKRRTNRRGTKD
jgi:hypothetical protein